MPVKLAKVRFGRSDDSPRPLSRIDPPIPMSGWPIGGYPAAPSADGAGVSTFRLQEGVFPEYIVADVVTDDLRAAPHANEYGPQPHRPPWLLKPGSPRR